MSTATGLRARKKQKTRELLFQSALELFEKHGYEQTTIEAIVEGAGVSRRTFFRYFESKESLAFPDHDLRQELFLNAALGVTQPSSPQERFIAGFQAVSKSYTETPELERRKFRIVQQSKILQARQWQSMQSWEEVIAESLIGVIPTGDRQRQLRVLATAMTAILGSVLRTWLEGEATSHESLQNMAIRALYDLSASFSELQQVDEHV